MNLHATRSDEILNSIDDPLLRLFKEFDLNAKCNPTSFRNLVINYLQQDLPCNRNAEYLEYANNILSEYRHIEPYKERDRVFRFLFLHHLELITYKEYKADWLTFWEKSLDGENMG